MASSTSEQASVKLNSKSDWKKWFHNVKSIATTGKVNVWPYIDPMAKEATPLPTEPTRPNLIVVTDTTEVERTATAAEMDAYRWKWEIYKDDLKKYDSIMEGVSKVGTYVNNTVTKRNIVHIERAVTVAEMLKSLKKKLAPNNESELLRVRMEWRALQTYSRREKITEWILKWEDMYNDALSVNLPEVQDHQVCFDFLLAASTYDSMWCTAMTERLKDRLEDDKPIDLSNVIERFQQQVVLHENDRYSKTPHSHVLNWGWVYN